MLSDDQLLKRCRVLAARSSGPGGMHRDHNATAVRITHKSTGIEAVAGERREQSLNKRNALARVRKKLAIHSRGAIDTGRPPDLGLDEVRTIFASGKRSLRRLQAMALALDALEAHSSRLRDAAHWLGMSTSGLCKFLQSDPGLWTEANRIRRRHGHRPLKKA